MQKLSLSSNTGIKEWNIDSSTISIGKKLGSGSFGEVFKATWFEKQVAVKILFKQNLAEDSLDSFKREVEIMSKLRHPNVLLFIGACLELGNLMIVTELMARGSLSSLLGDGSNELSFKRKMKIAQQAGFVFLTYALFSFSLFSNFVF